LKKRKIGDPYRFKTTFKLTSNVRHGSCDLRDDALLISPGSELSNTLPVEKKTGNLRAILPCKAVVHCVQAKEIAEPFGSVTSIHADHLKHQTTSLVDEESRRKTANRQMEKSRRSEIGRTKSARKASVNKLAFIDLWRKGRDAAREHEDRLRATSTSSNKMHTITPP